MNDSSNHVYDNHPALMAFSTWLTEQRVFKGCALVGSSNDHDAVTTTIWWAKPNDAVEQCVVDEGRSRGVRVYFHVAKYSKSTIHKACMLIFDSAQVLSSVGFEISTLGGFDAVHDGLTVRGYEGARPEGPLSESTREAVLTALRGIDGLTELVDPADIEIRYGGRIFPLNHATARES